MDSCHRISCARAGEEVEQAVVIYRGNNAAMIGMLVFLRLMFCCMG